MAQLYSELSEETRANELLERAGALTPLDVFSILHDADDAMVDGDYSTALGSLHEALGVATTGLEREGVYTSLYTYFLLRGVTDSILKYWEMVPRGPQPGPAYWALVEGGRAREAVAAFRLLGLNPEDTARVSVQALNLYSALGDPDSTEKYLAIAMGFPSPFRTESYRMGWEGEIARWRGDCFNALQIYDRAASANGSLRKLALRRAQCLRVLGRLSKAEEVLVAELTPDRYSIFRPRVHLELTRVYLGTGDTIREEKHLSQALGFWAMADPDYSYAKVARELQDSLASRR